MKLNVAIENIALEVLKALCFFTKAIDTSSFNIQIIKYNEKNNYYASPCARYRVFIAGMFRFIFKTTRYSYLRQS